MRLFGGPFPIFLVLPGQYAAQILTFDVYYVDQIVAGFVAYEDQPPPVGTP